MASKGRGEERKRDEEGEGDGEGRRDPLTMNLSKISSSFSIVPSNSRKIGRNSSRKSMSSRMKRRRRRRRRRSTKMEGKLT